MASLRRSDAVQPPIAVAARYTVELIRIVRALQARVRETLGDFYMLLALQQREDGIDQNFIDRLKRKLDELKKLDPKGYANLAGNVGEQVNAANAREFNRIFADENALRKITKGNFKAQVGLDLKQGAPKLAQHIDSFRRKNVQLITSVQTDMLDQVADVVGEAFDAGTRVEVLKKRIQERFDVTDSRAALIARDQVLKLNANITQQRQQDAGVTKYKWSTSRDERVRGNPAGKYPDTTDNHFRLEGTVHSWDEPPIVDTATGRTAHPGEDYQCRCVAIPIFDIDEPTVETPVQAPAPEQAPEPIVKKLTPLQEETLGHIKAGLKVGEMPVRPGRTVNQTLDDRYAAGHALERKGLVERIRGNTREETRFVVLPQPEPIVKPKRVRKPRPKRVAPQPVLLPTPVEPELVAVPIRETFPQQRVQGLPVSPIEKRPGLTALEYTHEGLPKPIARAYGEAGPVYSDEQRKAVAKHFEPLRMLAHGKGDKATQEQARTRLRELLAEDGFGAKQLLESSNELRVAKFAKPTLEAIHEWDGETQVAEHVAHNADAALAGWGDGGEPRPKELNALRAIIHEELHEVSPIAYSAYSEGPGVVLEEALTELSARKQIARLSGVARAHSLDPFGSQGFGSYEKERRAVLQAVGDALAAEGHLTATGEAAQEIVENHVHQATRILRSGNHPKIFTANAHIDAFADAVPSLSAKGKLQLSTALRHL